MSYVIPSVQVYEELLNSSGVADSTPDLEACIIGPAYNVLSFVPGSVVSLVETAATSAASALGTMVIGLPTLTFVTIPAFSVGDKLLIPGADPSGNALAATVLSQLGNVYILDTNAGTSVSGVPVSKQGFIVNPLISNVFNIPGQISGQIVDTTSIQVFANNAEVETLSTGFNGYVGSNALVYSVASGVGSATAASAVVTGVTNPTQYAIGDKVTIAGAGVSAGLLTAKVLVINGTTFTLDTAASTTAAGAVMTKIAISNVNQVTSTLMVEAGDECTINYTDVNSVAQVFETSVVSIIAATGTITNITTADILPTGTQVSSTTTAGVTSGATGFTLTSSTGFATGDTVLIAGAGVGGTDLEATIGTLTGAVVTGLSPATSTTVSSGAVVKKRALITLKTRKAYNNQIVPITKPVSGGANYSTSTTATDGTFTINPNPEVIYGKLINGEIHVAYNALRTDLSGSVMTINDINDNLGQFGVVNQLNPLALGCQLALANSGGKRVRAVAIPTNDEAGYLAALDLAGSERVYGITMLTQDLAMGQALSLHCQAFSTPVMASWRRGYFNSAIPTKVAVGTYTASLVNANSGNNTITLSAGKYILTSSNSTFITDNVVAGDTVNITAGTGTPSPIGSMQVLTVVSNQQLVVQASGTATGVSFYVNRTLSKTQRAAAVAATSSTFGSNRLSHVQPDTVVVDIGGSNVVLPGYYLCAAITGLVAGFPSQQGFTNIAVAGITDLSNSNFTFTRAQLDTMAGAGTMLFVQETSGGIPYCRHALTTDMSVYEYREDQAVRNWDFLAYYYHDLLKPFIGKWNITFETIAIIGQTINAGTALLKSKKLPRIGAPLIDATITKLEQNPLNKDRLTVNLQTNQPKVLNYLDLYLIV